MRSSENFKLTAVEVGGFKSAIERVKVTLRDLTVLAGQNSAGKSTVIQPLLLIKQTMEKPFDAGGLAIDGPLVQFTSADQFLSHSAAGRANDFVLKMSAENSSVSMFYKKAADRGIIIDRMEFLADGKHQCWHENDILSPADIGLPDNILNLFKRTDADLTDFIVTRERAMLVAGLKSRNTSISVGFSGSPAQRFVDSATKLIHLPGLRGNPERNYRITAIETEYPGNFTEYVASIIHGWQSTKDPKLRYLANNLKNLGLTWKVQTRPIDDTRVEILVGRLPGAIRGGARDTISIADVGFGVSQTLPVLVALLAASPGQFVFYPCPVSAGSLNVLDARLASG